MLGTGLDWVLVTRLNWSGGWIQDWELGTRLECIRCWIVGWVLGTGLDWMLDTGCWVLGAGQCSRVDFTKCCILYWV